MVKIRKISAEESEAQAKAGVLVESLEWMKRFAGSTVVIKFGGNAMIREELLESFAEDIVYLRHVGVRPVVVHGGGPQINEMLTRLGVAPEFIGGYRVTSPETMKIVRMVLTGQVNPHIVNMINAHGPFAAGLSGEDAKLFGAEKRPPVIIDGQEIDLGMVGDITTVRPEAVKTLTEQGIIPVISSISPQNGGEEVLNVNADAAASALAVALGAKKLVILTDVPGLYSNWPDTDSIYSSLTVSELKQLLPELSSGMVPKMRACCEAVEHGVEKAAIIDGRKPHSMLVEVFTQNGIGTEIVPEGGEANTHTSSIVLPTATVK